MKPRIRDCEDGVRRIFCRLRRKYVALTPEEVVRQTFVSWLIEEMHYPETLMANEVVINLNGLQRRCDTVVYAADGRPLMIVEYKAADVKITQKVFDQIARYNMSLRAGWLVVTNGEKYYCCRMDAVSGSYSFERSVPEYEAMLSNDKLEKSR